MTINFGMAIETDLEADGRSDLIHDFSNEIASFLQERSYGDEIKNYSVGIICLRPVQGFEEFSKERKPKFISSQVIRLIDGSSKVLEKLYSYDIKFDSGSYERFVSGSEEDALRVLKELFVNSLSNLDKLPKKISSFDSRGFKSDVIDYLNK